MLYSNKATNKEKSLVGTASSILAPLLLDDYPNARSAYSLRRLRNGYYGYSIRVRRNLDGMEQDIGFLKDGTLDIPSLLSFVGLFDGMVSILYDQSGNGMHLDAQVYNTRMPKIISAGVLHTSNGLPAIFFDGSNDVLFSTNSMPSPASHLFIFGIWQKLSTVNSPANLNLNFPNEYARVSAHAPWSNGIVYWDAGSTGVDRLYTQNVYNDTITHQWSFIKTIGNDNQKIKRDGTQLAQKTQGSTSTIIGGVSLGNFGDGWSNSAHMNFQEMIFYDTDMLGDMSEIEADQISHWIDG